MPLTPVVGEGVNGRVQEHHADGIVEQPGTKVKV